MDVPDLMIERLTEQELLAPKMIANPTPGGSVAEMVERCVEQMNHGHHVPRLKAVEAGASRYAAAFGRAKGHIEKMAPLLDQAAVIHSGTYRDGQQKEQALARLKDVPAKIVACCKAAVAELDAARKVLREGEGKLAKTGAA